MEALRPQGALRFVGSLQLPVMDDMTIFKLYIVEAIFGQRSECLFMFEQLGLWNESPPPRQRGRGL